MGLRTVSDDRASQTREGSCKDYLSLRQKFIRLAQIANQSGLLYLENILSH